MADGLLDLLASNLVPVLPGTILTLQQGSRFPLLLRRDPHIEAPNEVQANWTNTNLAVLHVAASAVDGCVTFRKACARALGLAEHAAGFPIDADGEEDPRIAGCLETAVLIRTFGSYISSVRPSSAAQVADFLPSAGARLATDLCRALDASDSGALSAPVSRQAALVVAAGVYKEDYRVNVLQTWPSIAETLAAIRDEVDPITSATRCFRWIYPGLAPPSWRCIEQDAPKARVTNPQVRAVGSVVEGVLATDQVNRKGTRFTHEQLEAHLAFLRRHRYIYFDHDRSRAPGLVVLGAHLAHRAERHEIHATVGAVSAAAEERLRRGGGFSVGFTHEAKET